MANYYYYGKKTTGEPASGNIEARTKDDAVDLLGRLGILPSQLEEVQRSGKLIKKTGLTKRFKFRDRNLFTVQMANLLRSGVSLLRAIEILKEQSMDDNFSNFLSHVHQGIKDGKSFSACLCDYPKIFSPLFISMIRAGEESGNLFQALRSLADYQKRQHAIAAKVKTALVYPIFMASVGLATIIFILTGVMPRVSSLFTNMGQELPWFTQVLLLISDLLMRGWLVVIPLIVLFVFSVIRWAQTSRGRNSIDRIMISAPWLGLLVRKVELARFYRTLEILLGSGIPLLRGLIIAIPTLTNSLLADDLRQSIKKLESGESLSQSFGECLFISPLALQLIKVGEESGLLEETLKDLADTYDEENNDLIKMLMTILEPLMILLVGAIVGLVVMAMLMPIFQMDILAS